MGNSTAIVGAGAMGSLFAARLAAAHVPVLLFGRPSAHLDRIATEGLRLEEADGSDRMVQVSVATDPAALADAAVLVILTKAWATAAALAPVAPVLSPNALVVTLQNGLDARRRIAKALSAHEPGAIVAGTTTEGALRQDPGRVIHTGRGETILGPPDGQPDPRVDRFAAALAEAGFATRVVADIEPWLWRKAAVNAAINGLTALAEVENGEIARDRGLAHAARLVAREVAAVAAAFGVPIVDPAAATIEVAAATGGNRSSMLADLERGERTEVDAIHGAVVARARAAGIGAPLCATLAAAIRAKQRARSERRGGR